jgi:hypothetical protein
MQFQDLKSVNDSNNSNCNRLYVPTSTSEYVISYCSFDFGFGCLFLHFSKSGVLNLLVLAYLQIKFVPSAYPQIRLVSSSRTLQMKNSNQKDLFDWVCVIIWAHHLPLVACTRKRTRVMVKRNK